MEDSATLLVAEPQFKGSVHATVNAALLRAAALACPDRRPVFLGETAHTEWVRRAFSQGSEEPRREVDWVPLPGLPGMKRVGRLRRGAAELRVWGRLLREARRRGARGVVVCSVTRPGILLLKLLVPVLLRGTPVVAVLHQLDELRAEGGGETPRRPVRLETLLALPGPETLRFAAPSRAVHEELSRRFPRLAARTVALDLPYLWQEHAPSHPPIRRGELVFGLFGAARRGSIVPFCRLAAEVRARYPEARFVALGYLKEPLSEGELRGDAVEGLGAEPLSLEELRRRAREVHYAVWLGPAERYALTLSAAFLDALSFVKPCVFLENPFIARCFEDLGDVGLPCADIREMVDVVCELLRDPDPERYRGRCERILAGRRRFSPEAAAPDLARWLAPRRGDPFRN